jgi:general nucleoside transport system permease protein
VNTSLVVLTIAGSIVAGTPLVLAALGEVLTQRSGVMNLSIDGMMLLGGVIAIAATIATGNPYLGLLSGALAAAAMASVHAFLAVTLRVSQIVSGLALLIVGVGLSSFIGKIPERPLGDRGALDGFPRLLAVGASDIPVLGPILFRHDIIVYLSWALIAAASYYIFHTRAGLALRAVGEDPATADAAGLQVSAIRYAHTIVGGALAGVGGAYLTIQLTGIWQDEITAGLGWIAFAMVSFSSWRPWRTLFVAYLFGALTNLSFTLQIAGIGVPRDLLSVLPFVMTIVLLTVVSARPTAARLLSAPAALAEPYSRESR